MIDLKRKENCTGCKACGDICPKGAISFQTDKEGFWYPEVDPSKCVDCHLCEKVCPELNLKIQKKARTFKPEYYAVVNKDLPVRLDRMYRLGTQCGASVLGSFHLGTVDTASQPLSG